MYKFRTMKMNAKDIRNEDGSTYNGENDPRVTKIGRILRKTSIDEIPQILNILKGDMSFIGPRPDLPEHIKLYTQEEKKKLEIRPGITGYNHINNVTFLFDLKILVKTILTVFKRKGVYIVKDEEKEKYAETTKLWNNRVGLGY